MEPLVRTIAIVGGGFSGTVLPANLLRRATATPTRLLQEVLLAAELRVHAEQLATALMHNERSDATALRRTAP